MKIVVMTVQILLLFAGGACNAQKEKKEIARAYHKNGKVFVETEVVNGKKNGEERIYRDNGNLMYRQYFRDDMFVDSFYQYSKDSPDVVVVKGHVLHISRVFAYNHPSGELVGVSDYKEKAIGEGLVKIYYSNGNVMGIAEYKDGKPDGIDVAYYLNGNLKRISHYKQGELIKPQIEFDSTGHVISKP